ncbi:unnamed protein product [Alternaria alternata]
MVQLQLIVSWLCLASLPFAAALPATDSAVCKNPIKRLEWRQLSYPQKRSYIDAVLCLTTKKAKSGIPGTINRFDDHHAVHVNQSDSIHFVGHFLLWHRYFVDTYEKALRECGYTGGQPYWDYTLDADPQNPSSTRIYESEIFQPGTGFGGNGIKVEPTPEQNFLNLTGGTGGGCYQTGPFTPDKFMAQLEAPDFVTFDRTMQGSKTVFAPNIHGSGHFGVGGVLGQAGDPANSPGEPLFYLHHANLDRIYWRWQQQDLETRLREVGGPIVAEDYLGKNVTLDFEVNIGKLAPSRKLKDLMHIQEGPFCYTY